MGVADRIQRFHSSDTKSFFCMAKLREQPNLAGFDEPAEPPVNPQTLLTGTEPACGPPGPLDLTGKTVYVVDSHSLIYQVFHALPEMTGPSGQPVGAVHGFVRDMLDLIEVPQGRLFDLRVRPRREDVSQRNLRPVQSQSRRDAGRSAVADSGDPAISRRPGHPVAVASTASRPTTSWPRSPRQVEAAGGACLLVTSDKDCRQLITDRVQLFNIRKNEVFDAAALQEIWGIRPDQVVDFQAIVGDKTDNIPGIRGIGEKGAGSCWPSTARSKTFLPHADEVAGAKRGEAAQRPRDGALKSRELVRLKTDMPIDDRLDGGARRRIAICRKWPTCAASAAFGSLARRIEALAIKLGAAALRQPQADRGEARSQPRMRSDEVGRCSGRRLSPIRRTAASPEWKANYRTIATADDLDAARGDAEPAASGSCSIPKRPRSIRGGPRSSAIRSPGRRAKRVYIPVRAPAGEPQLDPLLVRDALRPVLENPAIEKIGQNLKYDMIVLRGRRASSCAAWRSTRWWPTICSSRASGATTWTTWPAATCATRRSRSISSSARGKKQKRMDEVPVAADHAVCRRRRRCAAAAGRDARAAAARRAAWTSCSPTWKCR